jgi:hypothetical protein
VDGSAGVELLYTTSSVSRIAEEQAQLKNTQYPEEINQLSSLSNPSYESHEPSDGVGAGQQLPVYSTSGLWELRDVPGHYSSSFASSASIRSSHQMDPDSDRYADRPKRERLDRLPSLEEFNLGDFEHFDIDCALSPYHLDDFTVGSAYEGDLSFGSDVNPQGRGNPGDLNLDAGELPNTDGPPFGHVDDKSFPGPLSVTEPFHEPARESLLEAEDQQGLVDQTKQLELRRGHMDPPIEASGSSSHRIDSGVSVQFTPSSKRALSIQDCREEQDLCADGEDLRSKVDTMWEAEILESCGISPELVQYRGPYLPVQGVLGGTSYKVLSWLAAQQDHGKFDSPPELLERRDPSLSGEGLSSSNHVEATKTSRIQAELDKTRRENERLKLKIKSLEDCADKASQRRSSNLDATLHGEAVDFQAFLHFDVAVPEQGSQSRSPSAAGRSLSLQHSGNLTVRSFSVSRNRRSRSPSPGDPDAPPYLLSILTTIESTFPTRVVCTPPKISSLLECRSIPHASYAIFAPRSSLVLITFALICAATSMKGHLSAACAAKLSLGHKIVDATKVFTHVRTRRKGKQKLHKKFHINPTTDPHNYQVPIRQVITQVHIRRFALKLEILSRDWNAFTRFE